LHACGGFVGAQVIDIIQQAPKQGAQQTYCAPNSTGRYAASPHAHMCLYVIITAAAWCSASRQV
jgi:hypothetical protein